ncbi:MAG: hypothetical protein WAZ98_00370 [Cyclobacteriaceae bacterium]
MKVALFSRSIYPRTGGSAFVTEQLACNFKRNEFFVVGGRDVFSTKVYSRSEILPVFYYLPSHASIKGRGERFFSWLGIVLFPFNVWRGYCLLRQEKPSAIVGTFPDGYFLLLSLVLARICKVPYFTYFHNTYVENRSGLNRKIALYIQQRVFDASRIIFLISDGLKEFYEEHYPQVKRFETLEHCFNESLPQRMEPEQRVNNKVWQVAFTGNFNHSNIDATVRMVNVLKNMPDVRMNFYTPVPKALLALRGVNVSAIQYHGYLPADAYQHELAKNDIMVLTHGFWGGYSNVEYKTIFPTRTIELFRTGKPLFAHAPAESFLAKFLIRNECAIVADKADEVQVAQQFRKLIENEQLRQQVVKNAQQVLPVFNGSTVAAKLIDRICTFAPS